MNELTTEQMIVLKPGRDKPVRQRHPWIFSGSLAQIPADLADGELAAVCAANGEWLAQGYVNRTSQITVRLLSWDRRETLDNAFWQRRIQQAVALRQQLFDPEQTNTYRLINAESDYLPGLTVDRYADYLVMQVGTLGIDRRKLVLAQMLLEATGCQGVIERSAIAVRRHEGLGDASGLLAGNAPEGAIPVRELGFHYLVDLAHGQKTGFYTDQRDNRRRVTAYAAGRRVLNAFSYTCSFAVHALAAGAVHVTNIDTSLDALELGERNLRLNGFDPDTQTENLVGDVFTVLRDWRAAGSSDQHFDLIILDPPKFAQNKSNVEQALRGYKEINLSALHLLKPGGMLATFSCSGLVAPQEFYQAVYQAATDARRAVQVIEWLHQGADHPVAITFPEGGYLKGLICRVL